MINMILGQMKDIKNNSYYSFDRDYKRFLDVKINNYDYQCIKAVAELSERRHFVKPKYIKAFRELSNKYDYAEFRLKCIRTKQYNSRYRKKPFGIMDLLSAVEVYCYDKPKPFQQRMIDYIEVENIFCQYIGLICEEILSNCLSERGHTINRSDYLDTKRKTDILIDRKHYIQMKSHTFTRSKDIDQFIAKYSECNSKLKFIFYELNAEGLFFMRNDNALNNEKGNRTMFNVLEIKDFFYAPTALADFISALEVDLKK